MPIVELGLVALILISIKFSDRRPYHSVIKKWSRPLRFKIKYYSRYSDLFECDPEDGIIYISRFNKALHNKREYIYSIAHELGHIIGAMIDEETGLEPRISDRETKRAIIADEERAWDIARILLKKEKLYEYHSFNGLKERCLTTYRATRAEQHKGLLKRGKHKCSKEK